MISIERLCIHLTEIMHIPIQVYGTDRCLKEQYHYSEEQTNLFAQDSNLLNILFDKRRDDSPVIYVEEKCLIYGILCGRDSVYITGPCSLDANTRSSIKALCALHNLELGESYRMTHTEITAFCRIQLLMYETLTGDHTMTLNRLTDINFTDTDFVKENQKFHYHVLHKTRENTKVHNSYSQEEREQSAIRMGDAKALQSALDEVYFGEAGKLASTSMRQAKNMAIVIITLASRSAIAGGLLPEISFTMADAYIQRAENASSEGEAYSIARQLEFEYCELVHDIRNKKNNNQLVAQCKTLIFQRLHYKISNQDLADELRVNPSYLSRLFTKEEGINLKDYIIREKINYSKKQLIYTDDSYKDIANTYAFASQSYYGKMFKKWVGMTPREYRIRYADFDEA